MSKGRKNNKNNNRNNNNNNNNNNQYQNSLNNEEIKIELEKLTAEKISMKAQADDLNKEIESLISLKDEIEDAFNLPVVLFMRTIIENKNKEAGLNSREDKLSKKELKLNQAQDEYDEKNEKFKAFKQKLEEETKIELYKLVAMQREQTLKNTELYTQASKDYQDNIIKFDEDFNTYTSERYTLLDSELEEKRNMAQKYIDDRQEEIDKKNSELDERIAEVNSMQELKSKIETLESLNKNARVNYENDIKEGIDIGVKDRVESFNVEIEQKDLELARLRTSIFNLTEENNSLKYFVEGYKDPTILKKYIEEKENTIKELRQEVLERPEVKIKEEYDKLKIQHDVLLTQNEAIKDERDLYLEKINNIGDLEHENSLLEIQNSQLESKVDLLDASVKDRDAQIERLCTSKARVAEREERIKDIELPIVEFKKDISSLGEIQPESEIEWLNNIEEESERYGFKFDRRILYAFHTALKISDWSSIAVLAGVSGTGKSELPRLYSAIGGINFMNVSVQPNWDSQESMLGFFNSIDNKFDAQPVLRFLAQTIGELGEYMSIVLLDEMNLAHVEHYFAEFLSKLEERRGITKKALPYVNVKLGSGIEPYELKMERNILWTGTMNQDETTKSLSDKVLDRGVLINFPRPSTFANRTSMQKISDIKSDNLLKYNTWVSWLVRDFNSSDESEYPIIKIVKKELDEYKKIVEDINKCLGVVGRAIGHRVWQSIYFYILNYVTVRQIMEENKEQKTISKRTRNDLVIAMHTAFEDQIVQKIMPKLRGIETRGKSKSECLDKIKNILDQNDFNLTRDFESACEFGYGQFIWNSAYYLEDVIDDYDNDDYDDDDYDDDYDDDDDDDYDDDNDDDYDDDNDDDDDDDDDYDDNDDDDDDDDDYDDDDNDYDDDDYDE
ncbi:MAG: chromosome partitioning protein ParA [bacterium]